MLFQKKQSSAKNSDASQDFAYLPTDACYLDAACQTIRPQCVLDAEQEYYTQYNACGGRVKYRWGQTVDTKVDDARKKILELVQKSSDEYCVAFTLNTTYGINLVLHQLPEIFRSIIISEIEHNSVFLPSMTWAKNRSASRLVLPRDDDGSLKYQVSDLREGGVMLLNSVSNIDGRRLVNMQQVANDVHSAKGIILIDAAQGFAHDLEALRKTDFDAAFGSGHKMYGPSIGFVIVKRSLLASLNPFFIGGGTVSDVTRDAYSLQAAPEEAHAVLEAGLQNWSGIIGLSAAVQWLMKQDEARAREAELSRVLFEGLSAMSRVTMLNKGPSPIVSFYVDSIDAHRIALYLSEHNIMCRSGHFCCHSYLDHQKKLPPLLRVSIGLYTTPAHISLFLDSLATILKTF